MTTRQKRIENVLAAVGCPDALPTSRVVDEVWDQIEEDSRLAEVVGIGAHLTQERGARYGHPRENFARIGRVWSAILGQEVTPEQVGLCMIGVKLARLVETPDDHDSLVDISGYVGTMQMLAGVDVTV